MADTRGAFTLRDGVEVATRTWEPVGDPVAVMLIVHGLFEHSGRYAHVGRFFAGRGYRVHGFDLRGHGASGGERLDLDHWSTFVEDVAEIVREVRTDLPLVMYAHSMGGLVGALYAESDNPQPDALVLSAPSLGSGASPLLLLTAKTLGRVAPRMRLPSLFKGDELSRDPAIGEAFFTDPLVSTDGTARFGRALLEGIEEAKRSMERIRVPTLVVHGGDDTIVPTASSAPLAAVDQCDRRVFPGLRHEMHNEPEQGDVLEFVAKWLSATLERP